MTGQRMNIAALYVNRASQQWIVLDRDGSFWSVPVADESPWDQREPFYVTEEVKLERVPTHYIQTLGLATQENN